MLDNERIAAAADAGQAMGDRIFEERVAELRSRGSAAKVVAFDAAPAAPPQMAEGMRDLLERSAPREGVLIAEGDSWFDYPRRDVVAALRREHSFEVRSVAHYGDRVEDMAYTDEQFVAFSEELENALRDGKQVRAVLLSGGGNDIAGDEFAMLLNHARSQVAGVNEDIMRGIIDVRLMDAYVALIRGINQITKRWLTGPLPVIVHGYANPVPDGRGFAGGFSFFPGPWLAPRFRQKGFLDEDAEVGRERCTQMMATLIGRFNEMLQRLATLPELEGAVRYVDLRPVLSNGADYREDWANELHPTQEAFKRVAAQIAAAIPR